MTVGLYELRSIRLKLVKIRYRVGVLVWFFAVIPIIVGFIVGFFIGLN